MGENATNEEKEPQIEFLDIMVSALEDLVNLMCEEKDCAKIEVVRSHRRLDMIIHVPLSQRGIIIGRGGAVISAYRTLLRTLSASLSISLFIRMADDPNEAAMLSVKTPKSNPVKTNKYKGGKTWNSQK